MGVCFSDYSFSSVKWVNIMDRNKPQAEEVILFPMELIDRFVWNKDFGTNLRRLRESSPGGKISRAKLVQALAAKGVHYTEVSLRTLERGGMASIQKTLLLALLEELDVSPAQFFNATKQIIIG
jgi:hypothetical protein